MFRRRLVGLYALTLMEREGPLHGYALSERIARATEGAWRPGPGAVYPSLRKLVDMGLAKGQRENRRRTYRITPAGRVLLGRIRGRHGWAEGPRADLSPLWAEVSGATDLAGFLVQRLHRTLDSLDGQLRKAGRDPASAARLREEVLAELARAVERFRDVRSSTDLPALAAGGARGR